MMDENTIPKGWKLERLGDFVQYQKGKKPKNISKEQVFPYHIPYINIKAFEQGTIDEYTDGVGCLLCEDGDILMVWDGARSGYLGRAFNGAVGSTLVRIKFPGIASDYARYFLESKYLQINTNAKGTGIPHVDPELLWNYRFPVPPLPEQERIVAKIEELFSSIDKGIENLKKAQEQLKAYRQAVLKWAFEGRLTNKDVKDGELPEGWKPAKVSDIAEVFGGQAFNSNSFKAGGQYQVLRIGNIRQGIIRLQVSPVYISNVEQRTFVKALLLRNDIVITLTGTKGKKDYGYTALINHDNLLLNQRIASIRCKKHCLPKYLLYYSWTDLFKTQFFSKETGNVGQGNVSMRGITDTIVFLPNSVNEQIQITSEIESRFSICDKIEESITQSLQQAEALKQSILKKAFEGKLVPQELKDNPASEMSSSLMSSSRKQFSQECLAKSNSEL